MANTLTPSNFSSIPVLDYPLLHTDRAAFLTQLRHALIHVGFLYLRDAPVDTASVVEQVPRFFALQQEAKDRLAMTNNEHFLGYTKMGTEWTKGAQDWREQIDIATPHENEWKQGDPDYLRLWGPAQVCFASRSPICECALICSPLQWPSEEELPGFKPVVERFFIDTDVLAYEFTGLVAEALGLSSEALSDFFEPPGQMQHRGKVDLISFSI